jgi:type 1 fimbria pilin
MKKLFILLATLVLLTTGVMAAGSQSVDPVLNLSEGAYTINGEEVAEKELKQLKATDKASSIADGDKEDEVNAIIREQNGKSTVIQKLKDLLKNVDLENYYVAGKGFYNLAVV